MHKPIDTRTCFYYKNSGFFTRTDQLLLEALLHIDSQLEAIPSLREIIVSVDTQGGLPTLEAESMMQSLGWVGLIGKEHP